MAFSSSAPATTLWPANSMAPDWYFHVPVARTSPMPSRTAVNHKGSLRPELERRRTEHQPAGGDQRVLRADVSRRCSGSNEDGGHERGIPQPLNVQDRHRYASSPAAPRQRMSGSRTGTPTAGPKPKASEGTMCTIRAKDDHRKQAGVRPRRRLLAGSRPDPGPASGPGASRTPEGRRRLGQRYLPSGRRVGCSYTSSRGDGDIDRARATVAASIVMAIAHTRASASSCRRSQPHVRLGLVDRPMASWQESAAAVLPDPAAAGAAYWSGFCTRSISPHRRTPRATPREASARSANCCSAQTCPSARRRRGPTCGAQLVGPRAIGDAVAWTSAVAPRRSSSGQPARERWPLIGRDRFRRSHKRRSSD